MITGEQAEGQRCHSPWINLPRMEECRSFLKCCLKISHLRYSYELTTGHMVGGMASPRFNDGSQRGALSRSAMRSYRRWIRIPELGCLRDCISSRQKRTFAIVLRPIPTQVNGKTIRRILIFDNHPDSLRLVFESGVELDTDDAASRRERRIAIICGFILIAIVVGALLWPRLR